MFTSIEEIKKYEGRSVRLEDSKNEFGGGFWVGKFSFNEVPGIFAEIVDLSLKPRGFEGDKYIIHPDDFKRLEILPQNLVL